MRTHHKNCLPLEGRRFGRLVVISRANDTGHEAKWNCVCDCGTQKVVFGNNLRRGLTQSCGCLHRELQTIHGHTNHPLRKVWRGMIARCTEPTTRGYSNYGGRGITICDRWLSSFEDFASDMGPRPTSRHTLDRENNDGNYEPGNCRWATPKEQARNRSTSTIYEIHGFAETTSGWSRICGVTPRAIVAWMEKYGVTAEQSIRRLLAKLDPSLA